MIEAETAAPTGRIPDNIMHFVRTLRAAGLPLGPGQALRAVEAVRAIEKSLGDIQGRPNEGRG